jgi:hypothetical protein
MNTSSETPGISTTLQDTKTTVILTLSLAKGKDLPLLLAIPNGATSQLTTILRESRWESRPSVLDPMRHSELTSHAPLECPINCFRSAHDLPNVIGGTVIIVRHTPPLIAAKGSNWRAERGNELIESPVVSISTDEHKKLELRLRLMKDEIAAQANMFDQIDSKTGVALGFTFVVVGQVLAAVFRMAIDKNGFYSPIPIISDTLFGLANFFAILAICFGVKARWPRNFEHSIAFSQDELSLPYLEMQESALKSFTEIVAENERIIKKKGCWATLTYLLVGMALVTYLSLTVFLYFFSK